MDMCNVVHALKPILLMVLVQVANAWVNVLYKLALNDGMNLSVIVAYRYVFATAFIAPLAFILERFFFCSWFYVTVIQMIDITDKYHS